MTIITFPVTADQQPTAFPYTDTNGQQDPMSPASKTSPSVPHHICESSPCNELTPATNNGGHNPDGAASQSDDKNDTPQLSFMTSITTSLGGVNRPPVPDEQGTSGDRDTSSGEEGKGNTCSYELLVLENKKTNNLTHLLLNCP